MDLLPLDGHVSIASVAQDDTFLNTFSSTLVSTLDYGFSFNRDLGFGNSSAVSTSLGRAASEALDGLNCHSF